MSERVRIDTLPLDSPEVEAMRRLSGGASDRTEHACTCIMSTIPGEYGSCDGCKRNRESDPDVYPGEVVEVRPGAHDIPAGCTRAIIVHTFRCTRCEWRFKLTSNVPEAFRRDLVPTAHRRVKGHATSPPDTPTVS